MLAQVGAAAWNAAAAIEPASFLKSSDCALVDLFDCWEDPGSGLIKDSEEGSGRCFKPSRSLIMLPVCHQGKEKGTRTRTGIGMTSHARILFYRDFSVHGPDLFRALINSDVRCKE